MQTSVEETGPVERRLRIEIPTVDVDAAFDAVFREVGKSAHIRGFRKGKAPRSVLEKYYGEHARGEVLERLVRDTLFKAIDEKQLDVLGEPRLDPAEQPSQGAEFSYEAIVEIRPKIELAPVKGVEVVRPRLPEPKEDPVEVHLQQLRERNGQVLDTEEGTTSARGHIAVLDYEGFVDGEPFEGGQATEAQIELGAGRTIPGFEDNLMGLLPGDEREFQVSFPEDYPAEHLAGKEASFKVKLQGLKRRELPELDDDFAKDVSEYETLEEFRAELLRRVTEGREQERKHLEREAVISAVIEANPFPIPPGLVERQLASRIHRAMHQFGGQLPEEQTSEFAARWAEEWRPDVEREIKMALLAPEIATAHEIDVTPQELEDQLREIATRQGQSLGEIKKAYRERGLMASLAAGLLEQKVVEFLLAEATLSDG